MKTVLLLFLIFSVGILAGCGTSPRLGVTDPLFFEKPEVVEPWHKGLARTLNRPYEEIQELIDKYFKVETDKTNKKLLRNRIAYKLFPLVDEYHANFKLHLYTGRALTDSIFDFLLLGVNAAGSVVGGEAVKGILHAAGTGLSGGKLSMSQNWYQEKTTSAIVSQMDALRYAKKLNMATKLSQVNDDDYPLDVVLQDMLDYFNSGSLVTALTSLADEAAAKSVASKKTLDNLGMPADGSKDAERGDSVPR
ncbi:MAG: hypothetical protein EPO02_12525 [Nitrospirae bacterium]|nr:MAG: hypothetical protein EPO02_12525 [Nitrospirota bacterium]